MKVEKMEKTAEEGGDAGEGGDIEREEERGRRKGKR